MLSRTSPGTAESICADYRASAGIDLTHDREDRASRRLLPMPVPEADVEMECQLAPEYWGRGYVTEAAQALAHWAFEHSLVELFALVEPDNARAAATARRIGMEWVGESEKYHGSLKQVFRLRPDDLANAVRSRPG